MFYLNTAICLLALAAIITELWFILRRNRRISLKGKDDYFASALVMLFVLLVFPLTENVTVIESLRNILILVAMFSTMAIRRGLSDHGVEKLFFTVPWGKISNVRISPGQTGKVQAVFTAGSLHFKLIFPAFQLKGLLYELQKHTESVYLHEGLQRAI